MKVNIGDYVKGIEDFGGKPREMRGTVERVCDEYVYIQADDGYNGARGTNLDINTVCVCNKVDNWERALHRVIPAGYTVRHFKGGIYTVLETAEHVDFGKCIVYQSKETGKVWVREYAEFMSLVDRKKYPDVTQTYRFEIIRDTDV